MVLVLCFINSNYYKWMMDYKNNNYIMKERSVEYKYGCIMSSYKEIKNMIERCKTNFSYDPGYNYIYKLNLDNIIVGDKLNSLSYKEFIRWYCINNSLAIIIYCKKDIVITLEANDDHIPSTLAYIILPPTDYYKLNKFLKSLFKDANSDSSKDNNITLDELIRSYREEQMQRSINIFYEEVGVNYIYHIDDKYNMFVDVDEEKGE